MISNSGSKVRCIFEYTLEEKKPSTEKKKTAERVKPELHFAEEMKPNKPCLPAVAGFHSYDACLGKEILQYVSKDVNQKILIGNTPTWDSTYFELSYVNGTPCTDQKSIARRATVFFLCKEEGSMQITNVLEPKPCVYDIEIQTPKACGHPGQIRRAVTAPSGPAEMVENWFMEIMEVHGQGITCSVQASGFAQPTPTSARLIDKFSLRLETDTHKALPIKSFEVRHDVGITYGASDFELSYDRATLRTHSPLPDKFNIATVTAASPLQG